jgi:hypothetical protein
MMHGSSFSAKSHDLDPTILHGIATGDLTAIEHAGDSRNPEYIPYLKAKLTDRKLARNSWQQPSPVSLALAQLGDVSSGQIVWCWATQERTAFPLEFVVRVGGFYAVRALDAVMQGAGDKAFEKAAQAAHPIDFGFEPPRYRALTLMQQIISDGPVASGHGEAYSGADGDIQEWHAWITAHSNDLHTRMPTGDGVNFSDAACRAGRPVQKAKAPG